VKTGDGQRRSSLFKHSSLTIPKSNHLIISQIEFSLSRLEPSIFQPDSISLIRKGNTGIVSPASDRRPVCAGIARNHLGKGDSHTYVHFSGAFVFQ
jgi:hypothetical protein